jgi:hypothetical protein
MLQVVQHQLFNQQSVLLHQRVSRKLPKENDDRDAFMLKRNLLNVSIVLS